MSEPPGGGIPVVLRPLIGLGAVGAVLAALGHLPGAVLAWVAAPLLTQATVLSPAFVSFVEDRFGPAVARVVSFVLLVPVQVLIVLPVWLVGRLLRIDPLADRSGAGRWTEPPASVRTSRTFAREHRASAGSRPAWRTALAWTAVGVLLAVVVPHLVRRATDEPPEALRDDDGFNSMASPAIVDEPWAAQAATEFFQAVAEGQTYTPYVGYSVRDFEGEYVNVEDRERVTYEPAGLDEGEGPLEVWTFGGSTVFGFSGQRDEHTISSELARLAEAEGTPVRVRNFGAPGYVNFQETVLLTQLLLAGGRPDVVVFYDGINDLALQIHRTFVFGEQGELGDLSALTFRRELAGTATGTDEPAEPLNPELPFGEEGTVLDGLERTYAQGRELSRALAERYGFTVVHAWQPDLFSKADLDPGEEVLLEPLGYDAFRFEGLDRLSDAARDRLPPEVLDLGDAYDDLEGPVLTDQVHTNEAGARAVAEALWPAVREALADREADG